MLLLVNSGAGRGRGRRLAEEVTAALARTLAVRELRADTPAAALDALRSAAAGYDAVLVLGGDGTVHLAAQALAETEVPLGVLPAGAGNDFADALGVPKAPLAAVTVLREAIEAGSVRPLDLGRVEGGAWFTTVLCAGFDSRVTERADALRWPTGRRRYQAAIGYELARLRPRQFLLQVDGRYLDGPATLVAIGNGPQYGGGMLITPDARLDDGRFQVTVVGPVTRRTLARLAPGMARAAHLGHPAVSTYAATSVSLDAADTVGYADGERIGPLPLQVRCVPGALQVLVPVDSVGSGLTPAPSGP